MLDRLFGEIKKDIFAPVNGKIIPIEDVKDSIFAKKVMGDGAAFKSDEDVIYAPCNGRITKIAKTGHALWLKTDGNVEILLHVGVRTAFLNGEGFHVLVREGRNVMPHALLIKLDKSFLEEKKTDLTTVLIITDQRKFELKKTSADVVDINTKVLQLCRNKK